MKLAKKIGYVVLSLYMFVLLYGIADAIQFFFHDWLIHFPPLFLTLVTDIGVGLFSVAIIYLFNLKPSGKAHHFTKWEWCCLLFCVVLIWYFGPILGNYFADMFKDQNTVHYTELFQRTDPRFVFVLSVIVGPMVEELMMRGVFFGCWSKIATPRFASLVSALAFTLMHRTVLHLYFAFLLGIILAYVYWRSKNILYCYAVHAFFNSLSDVLGYFGIPTIFFDIRVWPVVCTILFLVIMYCYWWHMKDLTADGPQDNTSFELAQSTSSADLEIAALLDDVVSESHILSK